MKKNILSLTLFLTLSFFLSGLQGSFYFLPLPLPHFWFIILTFYSFQKPLLFILVANLTHALVLSAFSASTLAYPLLVINILSFCFFVFSQRFNTNWSHISIAAGLGCFTFHLTDWFLSGLSYGFATPNFLSWLSTSFVTFLFAPPLVHVLSSIDQRVYYERIDTLENLRI